jgi:hypothetical protein
MGFREFLDNTEEKSEELGDRAKEGLHKAGRKIDRMDD